MTHPAGRLAAGILLALACAGRAAETVWIEAEHLEGIRGWCWPMARGEGRETSRATDGHWALSGPGWAFEWNQGGESAFLSIACGAADDKAAATRVLEIPVAGSYAVWVRYRDNRELAERFQVVLEQAGQAPVTLTYGERPVVEENNEMKLYFEGAFGWDCRTAALKQGAATLTLRSAFQAPECRQVDCLVLTTDADYRPFVKERPAHPWLQVLDTYRGGLSTNLLPLARRTGFRDVPPAWAPRLFPPGFLYLWNVAATETRRTEEKDDQGKVRQVEKTVPAGWMRGDAGAVPHPSNVDPAIREAFRTYAAGQSRLPIFSDPRITPVFHGPGPAILGLEKPSSEAEREAAGAFRAWLDANPARMFGSLLNYQPDKTLSEEARKAFFETYQSRYVGGIAGESLGYFQPDWKQIPAEVLQNPDRRTLFAAMERLILDSNRAKYAKVFGPDVARLKNPYALTIPCQSVAGIAFDAPCFAWGAETVGYESFAATASLLGMRAAFLRGAARQFGGRTAVYRSCNFGDSATMFSAEQGVYAGARNIYDNYYSVFSGAGMTWYKFDIWYQYMAGAACFYHEQGFDEFWMPGGTTAAGNWGVCLSPKGRLVDHFLRVTARDFDRGVMVTPAAVLVDLAHGWDPSHYSPHRWGEMVPEAAAARLGLHDAALQGLFWTLYHPYARAAEAPISSVSETFVHGVFGDIFDVIYASPDVARWTTIDTYPVVFVGGDITLTDAEGARLAGYVRDGGTLVVSAGQLLGPGAARVPLPKTGAPADACGYRWLDGPAVEPAQQFRFAPIQGAGRALATDTNGAVICAWTDEGKGRVVFLSVPYGLGVDRQPVPLVARLAAHATRGLMPVEVEGDVEWFANRSGSGWMVTLINAAGQRKPQQGITPTDYTQNRSVRIRASRPLASAVDRLAPADGLEIRQGAVDVLMLAGSVRVVEVR